MNFCKAGSVIQHRQHHHHHHRNAVHHNQKRSYHIATTTAQNITQPVSNHENISYYDAQVNGIKNPFNAQHSLHMLRRK